MDPSLDPSPAIPPKRKRGTKAAAPAVPSEIDQPAWPAYTVVRKPIAWLKPYERNARTHGKEQVEQLRASLRQFGWTVPVLAREDGVIIAGHGRVEAGKLEGFVDVPVIIAAGWTEEQCRAYALADNRIALNSGWDETLLRLELSDLNDLGLDLGTLGFGDDELADWLEPGTQGLTDPDEVPDAPVNPVSRVGDLWILGRHRLLCGDATRKEDVERVLGGVKPHLMVTDPPYGVNYDPAWRNDAMQAGERATDWSKCGRAVGKVQNDDRADWREAWMLFSGEVAYVWHGAMQATASAESLSVAGFAIRSQIIWAKNHIAISRGHYHWQHEPCWYAVREGKTGHWAGDRKQTTLWQIDKPQKSETGHGTQKPIECMKRPIENNSSPGQAVYEPFCGSGTTIVAAEMTGRSCLSIEIDPVYIDVAVLRWQEFTGERAVLENDGRAFVEVAAERVKEAA